MREYGRIHCAFWSSPDIQAMSEDARLLALYLLSSPHTTIIGAFRLPDGYVCEDLKWTQQRVCKGFAELFRKGWANRCETTKWVWIRKFLQWNPPENPNQWKAAKKMAAQIPAGCSWKAEFYEVFSSLTDFEPPSEPNPSKTVTEPFRNQEQEQEQKKDQEKDQETDVFDPSSVAGLNVEAWRLWIEHRTKIKKPIRPHAYRDAAEELAKLGDQQLATVKRSRANGWQGLFPERTPSKPQQQVPKARAFGQ